MTHWQVHPITAEQTYALRQQVLRPGKTADQCIFEGDEEKSTLHLGIFPQQETSRYPRAICSLYHRQHQNLIDYDWQLRGMATAPSHRQQGLGKLLLHAAEKRLTTLGAYGIWANARLDAVPFYLANGYLTQGDAFDIASVGPHQRVFKPLRSKDFSE